jgi:hypothetical protein
MTETMTPRERLMAAIDMKPVDRIPFWPKLGDSYLRAQSMPGLDMTIRSMHELIGSDSLVTLPGCERELRKRTSVLVESTGNLERITYRTPHRELESVSEWDEASQSWHPVTYPVKSADDLQALTEVYEDLEFELDEERLRVTREQAKAVGVSGITFCDVGSSPLMLWLEWLAGIESGHLMLADQLAEVESLFEAIQGSLVRRTTLVCERHPADLILLTEDSSTTLMSPDQYRRYCRKYVGEVAALARSYDRKLVLHMCGHLKGLLPQLAELDVRAFEAFTSPPLGNTTLLDGRTACPGVCLVGGTNALLWTRPADAIIEQIDQDLGALPHHRGIVLTSGGLMPPSCGLDTVRAVSDWLRQYPVRMN